MVILLTKPFLGTVGPQDAPYGVGLMERFLLGLDKSGAKPAAVCCYTEGVRLVVEGSPLLPALRTLEAGGAKILSSASCLENYNLKDSVSIGQVVSLDDIVSLIGRAPKVVTV